MRSYAKLVLLGALILAACDQAQPIVAKEAVKRLKQARVLVPSANCQSANTSRAQLSIGDHVFEEPLADARAAFDEFNRPQVSIKLTAKQAEWFSQFSAENVGNTVDIKIDDEVVSSPYIASPIFSPELRISGNFTVAETVEIAKRLSPPC